MHFARAFRAKYKLSPGELVRKLRVAWAAGVLARAPARSIASIAAEAGFYDQSHFARLFKRETGESPRAHREKLLAARRRSRG